MPMNIMLATAAYPPGAYDERGDRAENWHKAFLGVVDAISAEHAVPLFRRPSEATRMRATLARRTDPEDVDGALIPAEVVTLIEEQHGAHAPLGWARAEQRYTCTCCDDGHESATPVVVYSGDFIVAICAPLRGSPCLEETPR